MTEDRSGATGTFRALSILLWATVLASCGGDGANVGTTASSPQLQNQRPMAQTRHAASGNVRFAIQIKPVTGRVRPRYVSPSTQSLKILTDGTNPIVVNLTPSSPSCSPNPTLPGTYLCAVSLEVPTGNHVFTVTAYDLTGAAGNVLSTNSTGPIFVKPIGTTTISLVLEGAVKYVILVLTTTYPAIGKPAAIGLTPILQDIDQNLIVGPAPYEYPVTLTTSDAAHGPLSQTKLKSPADTSGIVANYDGANVSSITYSARATGLDPGNVTNFVLASYPLSASPHLYLANESSDTCNGGGNVIVFDLGALANAPTSINCAGLISPIGVAVDATGKLYVTNNALRPGNTINVFDTLHGNAALPPIIGPGVNGSLGVAVGANGKLYIAEVGTNRIDVFDTTHGNAPLPAITGGGMNVPFGLAISANGILYVANTLPMFGGSISIFDTAHGNAVLPAITGGGLEDPWEVAIDVSGRLYVTNENGPSVVLVFDTTHGNAALPTIGGGGLNAPFGVAADASGKLYVANLSNTISVFDTAHGNAALATISGGITSPQGIAVH